jgi:hypothetical protein
MISQNADNDFFAMTPIQQKEMLDNALNIGAHTKFLELVKESRLGHQAISDIIAATISGLQRSTKPIKEGRLAELDGLIENIPDYISYQGALKPKSFYQAECVLSSEEEANIKYEIEETKRLKKPVNFTFKKDDEYDFDYYKEQLKQLNENGYWIESNENEDASSFEKWHDMLNGLEKPDNTMGFDIGPYNDECANCCTRKKAYDDKIVWNKYASACKARKVYLQNVIIILRLERLPDLVKQLDLSSDQANKKYILDNYDDIIKGREKMALIMEKQRLVDMIEEKTRIDGELAVWNNFKTIIDKKATDLTELYKIMEGFVSWLYREQVLPNLQDYTNEVIGLVEPNLKLKGWISDSGTIDWSLYLKSDIIDSCPPIEKASGFQRFICGFAVRLALGTIGASGISPRQLFLDEGFTSCDSINLAKVPRFLETLLQIFDGIVLVTHLEELKDVGNENIVIERTEDCISKLVY